MVSAEALNTGLAVIFCLQKEFFEATKRQFEFMLGGLLEVQNQFENLYTPFSILREIPVNGIKEFFKQNQFNYLVTDFSPLKIKKKWNQEVLDFCNSKKISFFEVDTHNIVPVWQTSNKEEYAARTIRPKIKSKLFEYLFEFPKVSELLSQIQPLGKSLNRLTKEKITNYIKNLIDLEYKNIFQPGQKEASKILQKFIYQKLNVYDEKRNDPNQKVLSNISPYLHFGQISAQKITLEINKSGNLKNLEAYLEELIIRRELSDNFCYYNINYDSAEGFKDWARESLDKHNSDQKEYIYSQIEFEEAKTHSQLWNAAQMEMVITGKMHGFMRMFWAKKILEWSKDYREAVKIAIYLNDKYSLDGRDPNGYVGVAWSIGGIHDRGWTPNVQYMVKSVI